jgi:heavy metal efflux system protein
LTVDRAAAARYQINVADVQDAIQTAVGGNALTQVLKGEARYDLVLRYLPQYRDTRKRSRTFDCYRPPESAYRWRSFARSSEADGASEIYREGNQRLCAIKYSVRGRDLGSTVEEAIKKVNEQVKLPIGYTSIGRGIREPEASQRAAADRAAHHDPAHLHHLYTMFKSFKWALLIMATLRSRPLAAAGAVVHGHEFQCFLRRGIPGAVRRVGADRSHHAGIHQPACGPGDSRSRMPRWKARCLRLRPIMMTMLVATLGLLPAACRTPLVRIRSGRSRL